MLYTLGDARTALRRFVDNGTCDNNLVDDKINDALERLTDAEDFEAMRKMIRISVCNRAFALPYNVEKVLWVDIDGTPARTFGLPYQFLSSGPGDLDTRCGGSCYKDLVDKGDDWPVQFDVPKQYEYTDPVNGEVSTIYPNGLPLVAFCTESADVGTTIRVRGFSHDAVEIGAGINPGEDITAQLWPGGTEGTIVRAPGTTGFTVSTNEFQDVSRIIKPQTQGYITLYAVDTDTNHFFYLAKYHPNQTIPQFRRYNITNHTLNVQSNVLALVKLRHVPLVHEDDILPIDSMQALKLMIMALREEDAQNVQGAMVFEEKAKLVMGKREAARTRTDGTPTILNVDYRTSLGRAFRRRVNI